MIADPIQVTVIQPTDKLRLMLDFVQLTVTGVLAIVAVLQARAANAQSRAAARQAEAADTQAAIARTQLKKSIDPRLLPIRWEPSDFGGQLTLQNAGPGIAYGVRWRFQNEWHWADGEDVVHSGDTSPVTVRTAVAGRNIFVECSSADQETFSTLVKIPNLEYFCSHPDSDRLVREVRHRQRGA